MTDPYRQPSPPPPEPEEEDILMEVFPGFGLAFKRIKPIEGEDLDRLARDSYGLVRHKLPDGALENDESLKRRCLAKRHIRCSKMKFKSLLPLTQGEVDRLPHGTHIAVIWSGGNGPWTYVVKVDKYGVRDAYTDFAHGCNVSAGILHFCGPYPATQVWQIETPGEQKPPEG